MAKRFLHIGPSKVGKDHAGLGFRTDDWEEVRLDIDPAAKPDFLCSISDMSVVPTGSFEGIFASHVIEHLYPLDVKSAFEESYRVLASGGFAVFVCPDLQAAAVPIAEGNPFKVLYESEEGPITALDAVYGFRGYFTLRDRRDFMSHRTGFTLPVLISSLKSVGFAHVVGRRRESAYELWALAYKGEISESELYGLAGIHFHL